MIGIFPPQVLDPWMPALTVLLCGALILVMYLCEKSNLGRIFKAIENNDAIVETVGIDVMHIKLLCLVIAALSEGKPHIPYRNSRLTRILQESLGGNSKTMMLVACSPATVHAPETHSTLRFATQCKRVKNAAVVNRVLSAAQLRSANDALRRELAAVKERLASVEGGALGSGAGGGAAAGMALGAGGCPSLIDSLLDGEDLLGEAIEPTGGGSVGAGGSGGGLSAEEVELLREQCEAAEMAAQAAQAELLEERSTGDEIAISLKKREEEVLPLMDSDGL
jgi:hypothetical protein